MHSTTATGNNIEILRSFSQKLTALQALPQLLPMLRLHLPEPGFSEAIAICIYEPDTLAIHSCYGEENYYPEIFHTLAAGATAPVTMATDEPPPQYLPYSKKLAQAGVYSVTGIPLQVKGEPAGCLLLYSPVKRAYTPADYSLLTIIAGQVAGAAAAMVIQEKAAEQATEMAALLALSNNITSCHRWQDVQQLITGQLAPYFLHQEMMICLNNTDQLTHSCYIHSVSQTTMSHPDFARGATMKYFINDGVFNVIESAGEAVVFDMEALLDMEEKPFYIDFWYELGIQEIIGFPLRVNNESIGGVTVYCKEKKLFSASGLRLAQAICSYLGIALSNILAYEKIQSQLTEINRYKYQLEAENYFLQKQMKTTHQFNEIPGWDNGLRHVFDLVDNVAGSDSTVLIQGETGTGKELIARAIHTASFRQAKMMVKVNCAALPPQLIESELFGHEKGSFTGATERRTGKFELAANGTLFLDEIGEMPLELQVKLLRAIQEKEIERIGGRETIKTDVRIIAATNRDLLKEVEAGRFRSDLYYRLNVFPIQLPPLRERREDIPMLVTHFIHKLSGKTGKNITGVSPQVIKDMMGYHWPGNVRELEHILERSFLMTKGEVIKEIQLPKPGKKTADLTGEATLKSLEQNERDHILSALRKCNGKIKGTNGAAALLELPATTLYSKMKKLGIRKIIT